MEHILFYCPAYRNLRNDLRRHLGDGTMGIRDVLGDNKYAVAAALFMIKTGLLSHNEGVAEDAERILDPKTSRVLDPERRRH